MGEVNAVGGVLTSLDEEVSVDDGMDCLRCTAALFFFFLASSIALVSAKYVLVHRASLSKAFVLLFGIFRKVHDKPL